MTTLPLPLTPPRNAGRGQTRRAAHARLTAAAAVPLFAAACAGGSGGLAGAGDQAKPAALKAGSTLLFWNDQGGGMTAVMQDWAKRFQQKTGVNVDVTAGIPDARDKITAALTAGTPPDVYRYLQETFPIVAAVERNMLLKIDSYVKRDKYDLADFRKDAVELYRWKGNLHALPRAYGLQCLFYAADLFAREGVPPIPGDWNDKTWTFQKFTEASQRLARTGERHALYVPRASRLWASFVYSNGGALVKKNADGLATGIALHETPAVEALQLMQDLIYKHNVAPTPPEERQLGDALALAQGGKLAMQITNPGGNARWRSTGMAYDAGVFPIGAAARRGVGGGGTGWSISGPSKQPEEAWALLSFITSKEAQLDELAEGSTTPVRISISTSQQYLTPLPKNARVFADGQDYVVRDPVHARWPDLERDINKLFDEQLWTGQVPAAQVARQIRDLADPILKQA